MIDATQTRAPRMVRLLDIEPDLGADLDPAAFAEARDLIACPLVDLPAGEWSPEVLIDHPSVRGRLFGALITRGLTVREVLLADRVCTQLLGPGDLLSADPLAERSLPLRTRYDAPDGISVALLDDRFLAASRRWPRLTGRLMDVAAEQLGRTTVHHAISQLSRVEDRLLALFWHLADRWASRSPEGVVVQLPLTHEALGRLIGARRPTVSLGLRVLAEQGMLARLESGHWLLDADSLAILQSGDIAPAPRATIPRTRKAPVPVAIPEGTVPLAREDLMDRVARLRAELAERKAGTAKSARRS